MDPQARFEAIFTAHYRDIHRFALRRTDPAEAEEVANEAFAICWAKLAAVPDPPTEEEVRETQEREYPEQAATARHGAPPNPFEQSDPPDER